MWMAIVSGRGHGKTAAWHKVRDSWRDSEGFGREVQVGQGTWSTVGPDNEDHAIHCGFIVYRGVLPCDCDATRKQFAQTPEGKGIWYSRWLRWAAVRTYTSRTEPLVKWPVTGPDGEPWVPGIDFTE